MSSIHIYFNYRIGLVMFKYFLCFSLLSFSIFANSVDLSKVSLGFGLGGNTFSAEEDSNLIDDSDSTFSLVGQLDLNPKLKLEVSYTDLGTYTFDSFTIEYSSIAGAMVFSPIEFYGVKPYGKLGYGFLRLNQTIKVFSTELENSSTGDTIVVGVGFTSNFSNFNVRLAYDSYIFATEKVFGEEETNLSTLSGLSLGVLYHF